MAEKVFEVADYEGNMVVLYRDRYENHICKNHPEFENQADVIRQAITDPTMVVKSKSAGKGGEERRVACRLGAYPGYSSLYVAAPIEYSPGDNWVVTAHLTPLPKGEVLYVRPRP